MSSDRDHSAREGGVATDDAPTRKERYEDQIREALRGRKLEPVEIDLLLREIGFTKLRFLIDVIKRGQAVKWIAEARAKTTLVLRQEFKSRRYPIPAEQQIMQLVLSPTRAVREKLVKALRNRDWEYVEGKARLYGNQPRGPDDEPILWLLRDAKRGASLRRPKARSRP